MTTSFTDRAGNALQYLLGLFAALATLAAMLGAALLIAPGPAMLVGLGGLVVLALYAGLRRTAAREGEALGQGYKAFYDFFAERFDALRVIKSLGKGGGETAQAQAMAQSLTGAHTRHQRSLGLGQVVLQAGSAAAMALAVWLALDRWQVPLALLLPLIALFARCVPLLGAVQISWQQYGHNLPAIREIGELMAVAQAHAEAPAADGAVPPRFERELALEAVTLRHEGRDRAALDAVSVVFPKGSATFVTGPSGSGKSTLADLLAGLVRPDAGQIAIDGTPLDGSALSAWRSRVAYVQQEPVLFDASVRENLSWAAPQADEAALISALNRASAGFVLDLPQGLDTRVGSSGRQLSGGEKQRIVLARALLRDPALLILDEATSALDSENEAAICAAVAALKGQITVVVIGHGSALAQLCDRTVRIEGGRVSV